MREVTLRDRDGHRVWATMRDDDGALVIQGELSRQSPWGSEENEYALTVAAADVPKVLAALHAAEGDDVLDVLEARGEDVVIGGERAWLRLLGITAEFTSTEE